MWTDDGGQAGDTTSADGVSVPPFATTPPPSSNVVVVVAAGAGAGVDASSSSAVHNDTTATRTPVAPAPASAPASAPNPTTTTAATLQLQQQQHPLRPSQQRLSELEELRQKGLAKLLNKHFTGVIKTLSKEKAEADAQLKDLEQRKAATSEFEASRQGQLSPFDSLYVQIKKKRNECRRKERETLLLYQRYVHKFGSTGVVQVPAATTTTTTTTSAGGGGGAAVPPPMSPLPSDYYQQQLRTHSNAVLVPSMAQAIDAKVTELIQMGVDPIPTRDRLGVDTTYQTLHARDSWELQQFFRRQLEERGIDARCFPIPNNSSPGGGGAGNLNPRKLFHGPRFPGGLPQLLESPGSPDSKPIHATAAATPWEYAFPGQLATAPLYTGNNSRHHHHHNADDEGEDDHDEGNDVDGEMGYVRATSNYFQPYHHANPPPHQDYVQDVGGFSGYVVNDYDNDYDDRSLVSGLTSVNSAATMLMHETENRLVQFLKTETEAIRKMLSTNSSEDSADHHHHYQGDRSVKSSGTPVGGGGGGGGTVGTGGAGAGGDDNMSVAGHSSHHSELGSHSSRAADQAEHMVKQMQEILHQFQKEAMARGETVVLASGDDDDLGATSAATAARAARPVATSNPNEEWVAYFDDTYQKEYYHEVNSNRTQWEVPDGIIEDGAAGISGGGGATTTTAAAGAGAAARTTTTTTTGAATTGEGAANTEAASECTSTTAAASSSSLTDYGQQQSNVHKAALSISHEDVMPDHHHPHRDLLSAKNSKNNNSFRNNNKNKNNNASGSSRMNKSDRKSDRNINNNNNNNNRSSSRRLLYLKKRRRQRNRRLVAVLVAAAVMTCLAVVWKRQYHLQETWPDAAKTIVGEPIVTKALQVHDDYVNKPAQVVLQEMKHVTVRVLSKVMNVETVQRYMIGSTASTSTSTTTTSGKAASGPNTSTTTTTSTPNKQGSITERSLDDKKGQENVIKTRSLADVDELKLPLKKKEEKVVKRAASAVLGTKEGGEAGPTSTPTTTIKTAEARHNNNNKDIDDALLVVETVLEGKDAVDNDEDDRGVFDKGVANNNNDAHVAAVDDDPDIQETALEVIPDQVKRPWLCNLPLAWLFHPYCWRLAHEVPLYCAHSLANSMMQ